MLYGKMPPELNSSIFSSINERPARKSNMTISPISIILYRISHSTLTGRILTYTSITIHKTLICFLLLIQRRATNRRHLHSHLQRNANVSNHQSETVHYRFVEFPQSRLCLLEVEKIRKSINPIDWRHPHPNTGGKSSATPETRRAQARQVDHLLNDYNRSKTRNQLEKIETVVSNIHVERTIMQSVLPSYHFIFTCQTSLNKRLLQHSD